MKLALSNLAWDIEESEVVFNEIKEIGLNNIEGVLTKFCSWDELSEDMIIDFKDNLNVLGIEIPSIQSLFYGVKCESTNDENIFLNHFKKLIQYSKLLSSKILVFGSPNIRKKYDGWEEHLPKIFKKLDTYLDGTNIQVIIEPNSKIYGGDYFFNLSEIVEFIINNKLKNIKTMIDTHNIILEKLDPITEFEKYYEYINHIHISENKLSSITNLEFHIEFSKKLKETGYDKIITYEVIKCDNLMNSVKQFYQIYK